VNATTGVVTYTPDTNFAGSDSFVYQVADDDGATDTATVTVNISDVNDPPVANDDSATTPEDTPVTIDVLANDSDVDGDSLTVDSVTPPTNGTAAINPDGTITYTPNANYNGADGFTYTISDGNGSADTANVSISVTSVNDPPVADIAEIDDDTITLPVTIKVTPQTLNMERSGRWVKVHISDDSENTPQQIEVTLDGSDSSDIDGDPLTYDWTLTGPDGDIPVEDNVVSQVVTLSAGSYTVTLVVNDGTVDSAPASEDFTLTNQTMADLAAADPGDFTLNGVPASEMKGGGNNIVLSFEDDAIAATVAVGLDVEMVLEGPVSGVDYIDVIQDKANGNGQGKSNLKGQGTTSGQNEGSGNNDSGKAKGKGSAPGQNKGSGDNANGKAKGK
jgi:CshA-type fibril repeat protein